MKTGFSEGSADRPPEPTGDPAEVVLHVDGVSCGACVTRVEAALRALPEVREAYLNFATRKVRILHAAHHEPLEGRFVAALARAGYRARRPGHPGTERRLEARKSLWRVALAGFAMMQVMMFAVPVYVAEPGTMPWDIERLFAIASLVLTVPVLLFSAPPIFRAAWHGALARSPGMDLPVALGIAITFVASVYATFAGGDVYYDSITMFVFFLLTARHFEGAALARTVESTEALAALLPRRASRIVDGEPRETDPALLAVGDLVAIGVGDAAPADLELASGATDFDEALVTGESAPVAKREGDRILAGTVNLTSPIVARVTRCGANQTLEEIRRLVERAAADKPRWALLADRIASRFAIAVLGAAALGGAAWMWIDPSKALWVAVTTLVVSCPCALSLATPAAVTAALNALARRGVLVTRARGLEALASVTHFVFDKTGTLTTGRMRLAGIEILGPRDRETCLAIAAALESALPHPMAHALVGARPGRIVRLSALEAHPGHGVEGVFEGERYRVGSQAFCAELCGSPLPVSMPADAPLAFMADAFGWLAAFRFEDALRPESPALVQALRDAGCEVVMLSGDRVGVVDPIADALGIASRISSADPAAKASFVERLVGQKATVAMVGDGVNDAPVLARSQVAIALGNGAAAAQSQADFVVMNPSILAIAEAREIARRTRRVIRQNLAWAAAYNAVTLPLALAGILSPWMASLGMSISSVLVVANALRLAPAPRGAQAPVPVPAAAS